MSDNEKTARDIVDLCDSVGVGTDCLTLYKTNLQTAIIQALAAKDKAMASMVEALEDAVETMQSSQADMLHCFENRCVPIQDEVNSFALGLESARAALAKLRGET